MNKRTMAIARATGMIGATLALAGGVTFANLGSTASLTGNTMATATAGLTVQVAGSGFDVSQQGFKLTGLVPGQDSAPFPFNLDSAGSIPLMITAHVPAVPTYGGIVDNGFSGVHLKFQSADGGSTLADTTLAALLAGNVSFGTGPLVGTANYRVIVNIDPSVVTGTSAHIDAFTITFTGTQQ